MSEWREFKIKEVANVVAGGTPKTSIHEYWNGSISWITPKDLSNHKNKYISNGSRSITDLGLKKSAAKLLPPETILLTSRAPIGYMAIAENKITTNQGFKNIICDKNKVNNHFLYYYLLVNMDQIKGFASGATFPEISGKTLKNIRIRIPNLETQSKIATILSTYDKLIENNNRRIQILEQTAEELYKEWFVRMRFPGYEKTKFDKGIPEDWKSLKLEDVCELVRGISYRTKDVENDRGTPMVTLKSVKSYGGYNEGGIRYYDNEINERHILQENDILMAITDMTQDKRVIGQAFLVPTLLEENVVFSADLILLDELKIDPEYFYSMLRFGGLSNHIATYSNGANVLHLNQRTLNKIKLIVAPKILREKYSNKYKYIQKEINILERNNKNLINQRDLLLPRLMNGTITVK